MRINPRRVRIGKMRDGETVLISTARRFVATLCPVRSEGVADLGRVSVKCTAEGYSQAVAAQEQGGGYAL
jgi:hypothetical protein